MAISDIPLFGMLRTKMMWHQQRQRLLAENVANADTPNFRPRDLAQPQFDHRLPAPGGVELRRTAAAHVGGSADGATSFRAQQGGYEVRPSGNAVNLEDEMLKVAANQMDYQAATTLYSRSLGLLKTAVRR
jgi:flagellar basal-body rod protein FlgB